MFMKEVGQYVAVYRAFKDAYDKLYCDSERENVLDFERNNQTHLEWIIGENNNENRNDS